MKLKEMFACHLLTLALVFPNMVFAEDFTFNVRVELSNLHPDVEGANVLCKVLIAAEGAPVGENVVGLKRSENLMVSAGGAINQTVRIKFNAYSGKNPADATKYLCLLDLVHKNGTEIAPTPSGNNFCTTEDGEWRCALAGKPFLSVASGSIRKAKRGNSKNVTIPRVSRTPGKTKTRKGQ